MKKSIKKLFNIVIQIEQNQWDYKTGQIISIPVFSNTAHNACNKFQNRCCGSEYPSYKILEVNDNYDNFLFNPEFFIPAK